MARRKIFVDTNVLLEGVRIDVLSYLVEKYDVITVKACIDEVKAGDVGRPKPIQVNVPLLESALTEIHSVTEGMRAKLAGDVVGIGLDDGERDLLAWLHSEHAWDGIEVVSADKAVFVALGKLDKLDRLVSLETLLQDAGCPLVKLKLLDDHFRESWTSKVRTKVTLGIIP